ncbi:type II secretion system minor pseudopilin GspK [Massilia sp. PAMC28688]|uniref:type II secretion system minor pseudopilin GspK n=1 Tax=Massilia sp. PAMC28688 TaxID=2861283 RepID=UPI001C62F414|nr:type II secretion system minor pseudopilin GspK [Massilia sp. PAMC28688]QYF94994.1 type II secretion system minor pseudopilin GspK [Massilia sp. PAMC28688]
MNTLPVRQRGVAVITALLLTTLAVTIVASLFWTQQVQVRSMENQRLHLQTKWMLRGGIDWSKFALVRFNKASKTSLHDVWNTPLAETRLDQFVDRERVEGETFDATLSGRIVDATSRYNLTNLALGPQVDPLHLEIYKRLLVNLQIDPALAKKTADAVALGSPLPPKPLGGGEAMPPIPGEGQPPQQQQQQQQQQPVSQGQIRTTAPMALTQLEDLLIIPGYTPEIINKLREYVIVLPSMVNGQPVGQTRVNVNTASAEVISALIPGFSLAQGQALVAQRKRADWNFEADFLSQLHGVPRERHPAQHVYSITSEWFLVQARVRLDRAALDSEALVQRPAMAAPGMAQKAYTVWVRQN